MGNQIDNDDKKRTKTRVVQLLISAPLCYFTLCGVLNYVSQTFRYLSDISHPEKYFKFQLKYFLHTSSMTPFMTVMISLGISMLIIMKLDQNWQIKNANKTIKGDAHFLELKDVEKILYGVDENDLASAKKSGIPLYRENGKIYMDSETIHSLIIGTTRSGKGQTFVMPMIRFICNSQAKHSMVINDPKGEMLENCYDMLIENGYYIVSPQQP